jgi:hypothetical protein
LTTLRIAKQALDFDMTLKDCSGYNVQFRGGKPILIDTLSFEKYQEGHPWVAYRQFCQHFLSPLALMCHKDIRLGQLLRIYIDGIPLDLASRLLPFESRLRFSLLSHIHLHARSQKRFAEGVFDTGGKKMSRLSFLGLLDSLESGIGKLKWEVQGSEWCDYYEDTNYRSSAFEHKRKIIGECLEKINPKSVWDMGANMGEFSRIASEKGIQTVAFDADSAATEKNYIECVKSNETNLIPLLLDLTNPSAGVGWANEERTSLIERGPADAVLMLALIHHLVISNNIPFSKIAEFCQNICRTLIVEFVPKNDSQVQRLLSSREDIFADYGREVFEEVFSRFFTIAASIPIRDSSRIIYLMEKRGESQS